jgi:uncharacterized protein (DUF488 family)
LSHTVYTIGHSTRTTEEFVTLLEEVGVDLLVDVRSVPRSRTNPQFNADTLPATLSRRHIGYRYIAALGGWRHGVRGGAPSPNRYWRNTSFRAYADYAATEPFRAGLRELCKLAEEHRCAIMCAEAVWWRCHRRIIADYLLVRSIAVAHILGRNHLQQATLTPGVSQLSDETLIYSARDASAPSSEDA